MSEVILQKDAIRIERVVTSGTFSLDGGTWDVDNNVWLIGDDDDCIVIDPAHDAGPILEAVGGRRLTGVLCTHAHDDHIGAAGEVCAATGALPFLNLEDRMLWDRVYSEGPERELVDGDIVDIAGTRMNVLHTPGHSPGSCCFYAPFLKVVFTGDTLFQGGPGATGRSFSDFDTIIESISQKLFALPLDTTVLTGHGDSTTIADEAPHLEEWVAAHREND